MDIEPSMVEQLLEWDERLAQGDRSFDAEAVDLLRSAQPAEDDHILFHAPQSAPAVDLAQKAGVDFAVRRPGGETLLFETDLHDAGAYRLVAQHYAARDGIDWADADGITALSAQVKFGRLDNARTLLELGASPDHTATVARYSGAHVTVPMQAVSVVCDNDDPQTTSIRLLTLLKAFGAHITPEHKSQLLERSAQKPQLTEWISVQL